MTETESTVKTAVQQTQELRDIEARAAQIRKEQRVASDEHRAARSQRRAAANRVALEMIEARDLNAEVTEAEARLREVLANDPVWVAYMDVIAARWRRYRLLGHRDTLRVRTGATAALPNSSPAVPVTSFADDLMRFVHDTAKQRGQDDAAALLQEANVRATATDTAAPAVETATTPTPKRPTSIDVTGMTDDEREALGLPPGTPPALRAKRAREAKRGGFGL